MVGHKEIEALFVVLYKLSATTRKEPNPNSVLLILFHNFLNSVGNITISQFAIFGAGTGPVHLS